MNSKNRRATALALTDIRDCLNILSKLEESESEDPWEIMESNGSIHIREVHSVINGKAHAPGLAQNRDTGHFSTICTFTDREHLDVSYEEVRDTARLLVEIKNGVPRFRRAFNFLLQAIRRPQNHHHHNEDAHPHAEANSQPAPKPEPPVRSDRPIAFTHGREKAAVNKKTAALIAGLIDRGLTPEVLAKKAGISTEVIRRIIRQYLVFHESHDISALANLHIPMHLAMIVFALSGESLDAFTRSLLKPEKSKAPIIRA